MNLFTLSFLTAILFSSVAFAAEEVKPMGFHDDSEVGIVNTAGNSKASTFSVMQTNIYRWDANSLKFTGGFIDVTTNGLEAARSWNLGLRAERTFGERWGAFVGQNVESDIFAGYAQRYNTDAGGKYAIFNEEDFNWNVEAGYRYTVENRLLTAQFTSSFLRGYTELKRSLSKTAALRYWIEYLPDLNNSSNYRLNSELSVSVLISEIFSMKTGYLVKYINLPLPGITNTTDSVLTAALVAKF